MKILLDECVPWPMHRLLADHECRTAQQQGWGGIKNGRLLQLAETEFGPTRICVTSKISRAERLPFWSFQRTNFTALKTQRI